MPSFTTYASALALALAGASAKLQYLGVAMAGIDFGCDITGICPYEFTALPLPDYGGADGAGQMQHFVKNDGLNIFRLPVSWQFLTFGHGGTKLNETSFDSYNELMTACFDTGAYCMIDLHNFARYNNGIIGQGGPSDDDFATLWSNIAAKYADNDRVVFGLMNEPHDLDIQIWAKTCQAAVTAIRKAGAAKQIILLPGTNFASATEFVSTQSAANLAKITNPDGSTDGLLMDLHKYLDINNSGQHAECTTDNVAGFQAITDWLRQNNRTAMVSETGASMDPSCMKDFCAQNTFLAQNSDVFVGFVGWAAGSFHPDYMLSLTPTGTTGNYKDNALMEQCILDVFSKVYTPAKGTPTQSKTASTSTSTSVAAGKGPSTKTSDSIFHESTSSSEPSKKDQGNAAAALSASGSSLGLVVAATAALFFATL